MIDKNTYLVLTVIKDNPNLSHHDLHKIIISHISWHDFLTVFQSLHNNELIDSKNIPTVLGLSKLTEYKNEVSNKLNSDNKIQRKSHWEFLKTKFDVINGGAAILFLFINFYQFCAGHKNEELILQKTKTIDSLQQVVSELTIQNTKAIHKDTLLTGQSDTISR